MTCYNNFWHIFKRFSSGSSLVIQSLRFHPPTAGSPGSIPGQGTRSHMLQLRVHKLEWDILSATFKTQHSQINKYLKNKNKQCACSVPKAYLTLHNSMDCSPPGSSLHEDSPGKSTGEGCHALLSRGSSRPRDWTHVSWVSCIGRWILYHWAA